MSRYRLHEVLVSQARPTASLGRLVSGLAMIVVGFLLLNVVFFQLLGQLPDWRVLRYEMLEGSTARALWLMLLNFGLLFLVLVVIARMLHERSLLSLTGPRIMLMLDFKRVLRPLILLYAILLILPAPDELSLVRNQAFGSWLMLAPISLTLILLQVSTEEVLFRGYIQSQLAARFNSPWIWMVLPSVLFGFLHYDPETFGGNATMLALWSGVFGVAAADLTARAGNLGPAIALHFVNNVSAIMLTSMQDHWDGLALYVMPFGPDDTEILRALMPIEAMVILCGWLVARIAIRR